MPTVSDRTSMLLQMPCRSMTRTLKANECQTRLRWPLKLVRPEKARLAEPTRRDKQKLQPTV